MSGSGQEPGAGEWGDFQQKLSDLKQNGCAFLVAGSVPEATVARSCRRAFGDDAAGPRYRLLVRTDGPSGVAETRLPRGGSAASNSTIVDYAGFSRSGAAAAGTGGNRSVDRVTVESRQLSALGQAIVGAVDAFDPGGGFEPGAVRVCLDSLVTLVCEHGRAATFRFLHLLVEYVHRVAGMTYVYLPEPRTSETVRCLEPVFDGVVELREEGGVAQQRWELRDAEAPTEWLDL